MTAKFYRTDIEKSLTIILLYNVFYVHVTVHRNM